MFYIHKDLVPALLTTQPHVAPRTINQMNTLWPRTTPRNSVDGGVKTFRRISSKHPPTVNMAPDSPADMSGSWMKKSSDTGLKDRLLKR